MYQLDRSKHYDQKRNWPILVNSVYVSATSFVAKGYGVKRSRIMSMRLPEVSSKEVSSDPLPLLYFATTNVGFFPQIFLAPSVALNTYIVTERSIRKSHCWYSTLKESKPCSFYPKPRQQGNAQSNMLVFYRPSFSTLCFRHR